MRAEISPFSLVGLVVVCCGIALLLRQRSAEQGFLFCAAVVCGCLFFLLPSISVLIDLIEEMDLFAASQELKTLLKAFGIGFITEFGSALCSDHGQRAFAKQIETAGRITILLLCLPMLRELLNLLTGMM